MARAEFDFTAASEEEISFQTGDMLNLAPKGKDKVAVRICSLVNVIQLFHFNATEKK